MAIPFRRKRDICEIIANIAGSLTQRKIRLKRPLLTLMKNSIFNIHFFGGALTGKIPHRIVFSGEWENVINNDEHGVTYSFGWGKNKYSYIFIHEDHAFKFPSSKEKLKEIVAHEMIHVYLYEVGELDLDHGPNFRDIAQKMANKFNLTFELCLPEKEVIIKKQNRRVLKRGD